MNGMSVNDFRDLIFYDPFADIMNVALPSGQNAQ